MRITSLALFLLLLVTTAGAEVIYVDIDATGADDGTSWADAYVDLQGALGRAIAGDEIWVAEGVYLPTPGTDRFSRFQIVPGTTVLGGFAGAEISSDQRDWHANVTVLSGDIGAENDPADNSRTVVALYASRTNPETTTFDGFTITMAAVEGGMVAGPVGHLRIRHVIFDSNTAEGTGGGLTVFHTDYGTPGSLTVENVAFISNATTYRGGGFQFYDSAGLDWATLTNAVFWNNSAASGGGLWTGGFPLEIVNASFCSNTATQLGGALTADAQLPRMEASPRKLSDFKLLNSILWGNSAPISPEIATVSSYTAPLISHSIVEGCNGSGGTWDTSLGTDGGSNVDADPLFVDPLSGDLHLVNSASPAVDAGVALFLDPGITVDLDGNNRIEGPEIDLGAYEFYDRTSAPKGSTPWCLRPAVPNPFNPRTTILYSLGQAGDAALVIYDLAGRRVKTLVSGHVEAGQHEAQWDGRDEQGRRVASGVYLYRLVAGEFSETKRMVLLK